jgi:isopenicillin N synthase-like dioxygenase
MAALVTQNTTGMATSAGGDLLVIPVIDISPLLLNQQQPGSDLPAPGQRSDVTYASTVDAIGDACRHVGFFYISNHHVPLELQTEMMYLSTRFFALDKDVKRRIDMKLGGKAWRGFFAVGDEFTSGVPDQKEGIYLGTELPAEDPRYLHGPNLWPDFDNNEELAMRFQVCIESYLYHMKTLGMALMDAIVLSLGLDKSVTQGLTFTEPTELFRIFNYPPHDEKTFGVFGERSFGVGEHTDYGYITILKQDDSGGLQIKQTTIDADGSLAHTWIDAPPIPNTFVINLGDALERMTGGLYRATPHRVVQRRGAPANRLSFPYFFDPSFDHHMEDISAHLREQDVAIAQR